jgi:hypothetical protein
VTASLTAAEEAQQRLEQLADYLLGDADSGRLTAAQRRWSEGTAGRLAG